MGFKIQGETQSPNGICLTDENNDSDFGNEDDDEEEGKLNARDLMLGN